MWQVRHVTILPACSWGFAGVYPLLRGNNVFANRPNRHPTVVTQKTLVPLLLLVLFLSGNYRLIAAPRKFDVLKTNICPRREASRANMLVLRTSNFQGQLPDRSIVLSCSQLKILPRASLKFIGLS